ncbi:MAG TPA: circularly permuted type 2 ATP-grasp protein, partial [Acidimicrobiales bacterium]
MSPSLTAYRPLPGARDAAVDAAGHPRPGWQRVLAELARLDPAELDRRQRAADRLATAEGAGYLADEGLGTAEPWRVSVVPFVLDPDTWDRLAAGLVQRARLLRAVLRDLTGPRELLRSGTVPVEAVAGHPAYVRGRPTDDPGGGLLLVGSDLVLDAEGALRVVRHRTDTPAGEGLALLARAVAARVAPAPRAPGSTGGGSTTAWAGAVTAGAGPDVVGHDDHLRAMRARLARAAPAGRHSPRTVVLSGVADGPGHVENAHLAARLGYSLAEPADVAVREGRVWLRSLDGPEPIDVLLRRVGHQGLDPVEQPDAPGGIAGLVHAARRGLVRLVNPAGAELAEHLALLPFLDDAARFLLGSPLRLAGVPTLWCGDPEHRATLLAAPER